MIKLLVVLGLLSAPVYAQDSAKGALFSFRQAFQAGLVSKLHKLHKGSKVALLLPRGGKAEGKFLRYRAYDTSIWVVEEGHWFATAFDISEVQDVRLVIRRQV